MFAVGDVVVCVDMSKRPLPANCRAKYKIPVRLGGMYRIASIHPHQSGEVGLKFIGIAHASDSFGVRSWRFRKLRKADTDIFALADQRVDA